jgi:hypothetical protein
MDSSADFTVVPPGGSSGSVSTAKRNAGRDPNRGSRPGREGCVGSDDPNQRGQFRGHQQAVSWPPMGSSSWPPTGGDCKWCSPMLIDRRPPALQQTTCGWRPSQRGSTDRLWTIAVTVTTDPLTHSRQMSICSPSGAGSFDLAVTEARAAPTQPTTGGFESSGKRPPPWTLSR